MGQNSSIEWTDHTFNPWWGCTKVSAGCAHCYAEGLARWRGHDVWGRGKQRRGLSEQHWQAPIRWNLAATRRGTPAKVFCASMADVFDDEGPGQERSKLWLLIESTPWLRWQLLTKRPENIVRYVPEAWLSSPPINVWYGASVEDRCRTNRIDVLQNIPAATRFLSVEPLLEDVGELNLEGIDWVIAGGESGQGARPMRVEWARSVRDQCVESETAFFFKQWGKLHNNPMRDDTYAKENGGSAKGGRLLDGVVWSQFPDLQRERSVVLQTS